MNAAKKEIESPGQTPSMRAINKRSTVYNRNLKLTFAQAESEIASLVCTLRYLESELSFDEDNREFVAQSVVNINTLLRFCQRSRKAL